MIKNLLYSLFLHFLLLLAIYANFNLTDIDENKVSEISVSLVALSGNDGSNKIKPSSEADTKADSEAKIEPTKKTESPKESPKNKVSEQPKTLAKSKPNNSAVKPVEEEKIQEFKQEKKPEENQKETNKIKDDEMANNDPNDEQNKISKKEKDLGSKEKFNEKQEESDQKDPTKNDSPDIANNLENLDLSAREKFNIQSQLSRCYRRALDETKLSSKSKILIKVQVSEDGYIDSDLDEMIDLDRYNDPTEPFYKISIDNVRRAIDLCSPLRNLPLDKYDIWKEVVLEFDDDE
jgi:outer membrane biosynthesis protein TonB